MKKVAAKDATPQQVEEMKKRLAQQRSDRWNDIHMDDGPRMVQAKRNPVKKPHQGTGVTRESVIVSAGLAATAGSAAALGSMGAIPAGYALAMAGVAAVNAFHQIYKGVCA